MVALHNKKARSAKRYAPSVAPGVPFSSRVWRIAPPMDGQKKSHGSFDRDIPVDNRSSLLDPQHESLAYHISLWVWTMINDPRESAAMSPGTLSSLRVMAQTGARWMISEGMQDFSAFDSAASWRFLDFFLRTHEEVDLGNKRRQRRITYASANTHLQFVRLVHRQRRALARFGVYVPEEVPFDGRGVENVVKNDLDLYKGGKLEPIADAVAIEMLNKAHRWLGVPADEVLALQEACCDKEAYRKNAKKRSGDLAFYAASKEVIRNFQFSVLEGESEPWTSLATAYERTLRDGRKGRIDGRQMVRRLVLTVQAAAIIAIQACAGVHASELASMEDVAEEGLLPSCVITRQSSDGLLELFYCRGVELKTLHEPKEWLIGSRLIGSDDLPLPVRAFSVLHRLFARWRKVGRSRKLFLTFSSAQGLPSQASSVGRPSSQYLTYAQKDFLREHCETSHLSEEELIRFCDNDELRGQLWRTTFATFLYRTDPRLLEPISRHFHHLSIAMTETNYVGNDAKLLEATDSSQLQQSSLFFYEALEEGSAIVGGLAEDMRDFPRLPGKTLDDFKLVVIENDLRLLAFDYGMCGIALNPEKSRCNKLGETARWSKRSPNEAFRSPSTCLGCPLFVASRLHLPYWIQRQNHLQAQKREERRNLGKVLLITERRLAAAKVMVQRLSA